MAEITASESRNKRKGFSAKGKGHKLIRVDLTPMVDLGFLLITFFVFTTSMATPKVMDLNEIHDGPPKAVKSSSAMTILLSKNHEIYYYNGQFESSKSVSQIQRTDLKGIRSVIADKKSKTNSDFLMFIIKSDAESTFGDAIDLLDEMAICKIPSGHYAEVSISEEELEVIKLKSLKK